VVAEFVIIDKLPKWWKPIISTSSGSYGSTNAYDDWAK